MGAGPINGGSTGRRIDVGEDLTRRVAAGRISSVKAPSTLAALALACVTASSSVEAALVLSDNFDAPDSGNFDNSDQTGRRDGILGPEVQLRSSRIQHTIAGNQLVMGRPGSGSGRIRFHDAANLANWHNFAAGTAGMSILAAGGMRVEFDWTPVNNTNDNWVSWSIGISNQAAGEPGIRVNHAATDFGILFRHNGGTQYFDNGAATTGESFTAGLDPRHVMIDFYFASFDDGSDATVSASVDGTPVLSGYGFQWDGNAGAFHMELGGYENGTLIDNFRISTIPEPSSLALVGLGVAMAARRRRRRS